MKRQRRILIYGATGFTGALVTRAALELSAELVLAGRDPERLEAVARPLGRAFRAFTLDSPSQVADALTDIDVVLNAAGPLVDTAAPLIAACLAARTHYLDVTGELSVFVDAHRFDAAARERGIMIMPGAGFWIVASDCLAADVANLLPGAKYLRLGCSGSELFSRGSLRTVFRAMQGQIVIRRSGRLSSVPIGRLERQFDYGDGERSSTAVSLPDVFTAHFTTGIPNIETYLEANLLARTVGLVGVGLTAAVGATGLRPLLDLGFAAWPQRPSDSERASARQTLVMEAEDGWRRYRRVRFVTSDGYTFTADAAAAVAKRVIGGDFAPGFQTPGKLYGPEFVLSIPNTHREDLDEIARGEPIDGEVQQHQC
jgi:saccharopine dehydrogenase (NAD+, L-lysine-forming)